MQIHGKREIIAALDEKADAFNQYIAALNKKQFEASPDEKWSAGQNQCCTSSKQNPGGYFLVFTLLKIIRFH